MNKKGIVLFFTVAGVVLLALSVTLNQHRLGTVPILNKVFGFDPLSLSEECFDFWKKELKDPFSAKFVDSNFEEKQLAPDSSRMVEVLTVEYRAKNSYGAYMPGYFECTLKDGKIDEMGSRIRAEINEE